MQITTKAIVIQRTKFSEADLVVKCFTETSGLKSYMLKGVLKSRKGKIRASYFQPLTLLEITANHKDKGSLEYMKEVKVASPYQTLHTEVLKTAIVLFLSEVLKQTIREEEKNTPLFHFLETAFLWLDHRNKVANFPLVFLVELTGHLGFYPDITTVKNPIFNPVEGVFQHEPTTIYCIPEKESEVLKGLFGTSFDAAGQVKLTTKQRQSALESVLLYYQLHVQGFTKPKSLEVLRHLFR